MDGARLSRGQFLQRGALVGAFAATGRWAGPRATHQPSFAPNPIPGGLAADFTPVPSDPLVHVFFPQLGNEVSTITDFNGVVGAAEIQGTATGGGVTYDFDVDMRFMKGRYITVDGKLHDGAFAFV
jgi:hypothetical protein